MVRLWILVAFGLLAACDESPATLTFAGETMGTTYSVVAVDPSGELDADTVQTAIDAALADVNGKMSNWDPNSEVSQFNASESTEPIEISAEFLEVMEVANTVHTESEGQFDVTLGPLIELWGFGTRNSESPVPPDGAIADALDQVGQLKLLDLTEAPATLAKSRADATVFLAAIAKGYGADRIGGALAEFGIADYLVEIGGDLITSGLNPEGEPWRIGIERPDSSSQTVEETIAFSGLGMATSGDYRNYFEEDGVRYSHIIDAETGRPITHLTASVTVLAPTAMEADAWATAMLALGKDRALPISEKLDLPVFFIERDPSLGDNQFATTANAAFEALKAAE
ncbi:MAG: FAD:protein FMN transferase [Pseudomonadota bacterium]